MKIFSNFDTRSRERVFREYKQKYGEDNVLCFGRSKLYRVYKFFLPVLFVTLFGVLSLIGMYEWFGVKYFGYVVISVLIIFLVFFIPAIGKYIDYKMDFIIVIPSSVILYDQSGIFKKNIITISSQSIKSIQVNKNKLLYSIFDNGDIVILTEGDVLERGEITLHRVPRPEKRKNQMVRVIGIDLEADQNPH